ncbi:DUF3662 and FHA domain-containing protein [Microbacteriaceae bacterium VKM Ac-2855]|nr:DUF3662 and FHA domain-containing protein [Microbacteriaceae bacterium VKM Ac-2855]
MGLLDNFEKGLERVVNGAFARTFKSGLQPVELASALRREMDTNAAIVSRDRILVPNEFTLRMSAADEARMRKLGPTLIDELTSLATQHATKQNYRFTGPIEIRLATDPALSDGMVEIDSRSVKGTVARTASLDIDGTRHPITQARTVLGRGSEADITVDDPGISRKHVEILWDGSRAQVHDLGSTNGSKLDGQRVSQAALEPDQTITIGRTRIVFRIVTTNASARPTASRAPRPSAQSPSAQGRSTQNRSTPPQPSKGSRDVGGFWDDRL